MFFVLNVVASIVFYVGISVVVFGIFWLADAFVITPQVSRARAILRKSNAKHQAARAVAIAIEDEHRALKQVRNSKQHENLVAVFAEDTDEPLFEVVQRKIDDEQKRKREAKTTFYRELDNAAAKGFEAIATDELGLVGSVPTNHFVENLAKRGGGFIDTGHGLWGLVCAECPPAVFWVGEKPKLPTEMGLIHAFNEVGFFYTADERLLCWKHAGDDLGQESGARTPHTRAVALYDLDLKEKSH